MEMAVTESRFFFLSVLVVAVDHGPVHSSSTLFMESRSSSTSSFGLLISSFFFAAPFLSFLMLNDAHGLSSSFFLVDSPSMLFFRFFVDLLTGVKPDHGSSSAF